MKVNPSKNSKKEVGKMKQLDKYTYEIDGEKYDSRDIDIWNYIIKPRLDELEQTQPIKETKTETVKVKEQPKKSKPKKETNSNINDDLTDKEYYTESGNPILMPIPSDKRYTSTKGVNMLNYGILTYFSNFQNDHDVEGFDSYDTDRYIYEKKVLKNKELVEQYSKTKINTFIRNARKTAKLTGSEIITVDTVKGETVYRLLKGEKYVLIERKILEILISYCNDNVFKMYMFFKWRLKDGGNTVTRKEIADYLGYCVNNQQMLGRISTDIETFLIKLGLIRKELIVLESTEDKPYNKACYYEVVPYEEWIEFWNNGKNAIDFLKK